MLSAGDAMPRGLVKGRTSVECGNARLQVNVRVNLHMNDCNNACSTWCDGWTHTRATRTRIKSLSRRSRALALSARAIKGVNP